MANSQGLTVYSDLGNTGSVILYDQVGHTGKSQRFPIPKDAKDIIVIYNDPKNLITVRSIKNDSNYYVMLYYGKGDNAFGGKYINIFNDSNNISSLVTIPAFNGILLRKRTIWLYNAVTRDTVLKKDRFWKTTPDATTLAENIINGVKYVQPTKTSENVIPLESIDKLCPWEYARCSDNMKIALQQQTDLQSVLTECESSVSEYNSVNMVPVHEKYRSDLKTIKYEIEYMKRKNAIRQEQINSFKYTEYEKMIFAIVTIIDLFMLFYILYRHDAPQLLKQNIYGEDNDV